MIRFVRKIYKTFHEKRHDKRFGETSTVKGISQPGKISGKVRLQKRRNNI